MLQVFSGRLNPSCLLKLHLHFLMLDEGYTETLCSRRWNSFGEETRRSIPKEHGYMSKWVYE